VYGREIKDRILGIKNITLLDGVNKTQNQFMATRLGVVAGIEWATGFIFAIELASLAMVLFSPETNLYKVIYTVAVSFIMLIAISVAVGFPYYVYKTSKR